MEQLQLDTTFSAESERDAVLSPAQPPTDQPEARVNEGILSYDSEASNSYFDNAFHEALSIGPQADFKPNPEILNIASDNNRVAGDLPPIAEELNTAPASQSVLIVEDKGSPGCVQFIDLTKDNDNEVLVLDANPRPSSRSRRTIGRKASTLTNSNDPDCLVVIEEIRPTEPTSRANRRTIRHSMRPSMLSNAAAGTVHDVTIVLDDESPSTTTTTSLPDVASLVAPPTTTTNPFPSVNTLIPGLAAAPTRNLSVEELSEGTPTKRIRYEQQERLRIDSIAEQLLSLVRNPPTAASILPGLNAAMAAAVYPNPPTTSAFQPLLHMPAPPQVTPTVTATAAAAANPPVNSRPRYELQCPICLESLEELRDHNKILMATLCGHVLCNSCLDEHFKASSRQKTFACPTCRGKLTKSKIHNLYL